MASPSNIFSSKITGSLEQHQEAYLFILGFTTVHPKGSYIPESAKKSLDTSCGQVLEFIESQRNCGADEIVTEFYTDGMQFIFNDMLETLAGKFGNPDDITVFENDEAWILPYLHAAKTKLHDYLAAQARPESARQRRLANPPASVPPNPPPAAATRPHPAESNAIIPPTRGERLPYAIFLAAGIAIYFFGNAAFLYLSALTNIALLATLASSSPMVLGISTFAALSVAYFAFTQYSANSPHPVRAAATGIEAEQVVREGAGRLHFQYGQTTVTASSLRGSDHSNRVNVQAVLNNDSDNTITPSLRA